MVCAFFLIGLPRLVRPYWPHYLAWLGGSTKSAFVWGPLIASGSVTLIGNLAYALIYASGIPALEAHRVNRRAPWPWAVRSPAARYAFWRLTALSVALTIMNHVLLLAATWLNWPVAAALGFRADAASFPGPLEVAANLVFFAFLEDCAFYFGHRALHVWPTWYRAIHKMHHEYTHTIAPAVLHLHPVEFLVSAAQTHPPPFRSHILHAWVMRPLCARPAALQCHPRRPWPPPRRCPRIHWPAVGRPPRGTDAGGALRLRVAVEPLPVAACEWLGCSS
jgi:sterol desaturase/sphingolipid hydroxylase (fatty acid hydroxylase superfamily)